MDKGVSDVTDKGVNDMTDKSASDVAGISLLMHIGVYTGADLSRSAIAILAEFCQILPLGLGCRVPRQGKSTSPRPIILIK